MDQYLSTVIVALITGIFSTIAIIIQKRQDKVIKKIDEQTLFIEKEKDVKQRIQAKEKEREGVIHEIMILILDTNLKILRYTQDEGGLIIDEGVYAQCDKLKERFDRISDELGELNKEYEVVLDMSAELQHEIEGRKKN